MTEKVTISKSEYDRLTAKAAHLNVLKARGVDNWGDYVGSLNNCAECDEEMSWATFKCPECGTEVDDEY